MNLKARVKKDTCIGCGACTVIADKIFQIGDDGLAEVVNPMENENDKIMKITEEEKENVIEEKESNEGIKEIDASTLSVSLSQFKMSQMKDNHKLIDSKEKTELIDCKNELMLVRQEKDQLEQLVKLLEASLKLERKEKLGLINENAMLKKKIQKLTQNNKK